MFFSTTDDICQFIIESIEAENLRGYEVWHDWGSFSIKTDFLSIAVDYWPDSLLITHMSIGNNGKLHSTFNYHHLSFLQTAPDSERGKAIYKDRLKFRINEWFLSFMGLVLEDLFDLGPSGPI
jgi:hypothetical protein